MQKPHHIESAALAISNQLSANIPLREIIARMPKIQPEFSEFWSHCSSSMRHGTRLSTLFEEASNSPNAWPDAYVHAIRAGEQSNSLQPVFSQIAASSKITQQISNTYSKLISPIAAITGGFIMFLFYMIAVIPGIQSNLGGQTDIVLSTALWMKNIAYNYWWAILIALSSSSLWAASWYSQPSSKQTLFSIANKIPKLGTALQWIYFSQWAFQIAILDSAGLTPKQQLLLSLKTLPTVWQPGIILMADELEKKGLASSSDPDKLPPNDPRTLWPFYINIAFQIAHETGNIHKEMSQIAPLLLEDGLRQLSKFISIADLSSKIIAAVMIAIPLLAYFNQMANSLTNSMK